MIDGGALISGHRLVSLTEIARLAQVGRPTVSNWRRRHESFPPPIDQTTTQPLFDAVAVAEWLTARPVPEGDGEETYGDRFRNNLSLGAFASMRSTVSGDDLLAIGIAAAAARAVVGEPIPAPPELAAYAARAAVARPSLAEVLTPRLAAVPPAAAALLADVETYCRDGGCSEAVDRLLETADRIGANARNAMTPSPVAQLVASLVTARSTKVVHDPAAGSGVLIRAVARAVGPRVQVVATDIDPGWTGLLRAMLACDQVSARVACRDALSEPHAVKADAVVVDPPFAPTETTDIEQGPKPWIDYTVSHLAPGGRGYVLVPTWLLTHPGKARHGGRPGQLAEWRRAVVNNHCLRAVIQLPRRSHTFRTGAEWALLVLTSPGEAAEMLFCDADRIAARVGPRWPEQTATTVEHALNGTATRALKDTEAIASVAVGQVVGAQTLLPVHHLTMRTRPDEYLDRLLSAQRRLAGLSPATPVLSRLPIIKTDGRPHVSVAACLRRGWLLLIPGHRIRTEHIGSEGISVIGAEELTLARPRGERRIDQMTAGDYPALEYTLPGDVVVLPSSNLRTLVDEPGTSVVVSPAQILRLTDHPQAGLTSRVLAALLAVPRNAGRAAGSLARRVSLRDLELPELSPDEAKHLDALLTELHSQRDTELARLAAYDDLLSSLTSGVADGALRIEC